MVTNREYWYNRSDYEYLYDTYISIVREGFRRENIAAARRSWNRKSIIMAVITVIGFVVLIACRK